MAADARLVCTKCGNAYPDSQPRWICECGSLLDLDFVPLLDPDRIARRKPTMWRYREAIPVGRGVVVSFDEGFTPLLEMSFGGRGALVKQDHLFPTGSYKDRGASVLVSKARELGIAHVVEDSSGNAGCAVAAYCARAGIRCEIYVPQHTSAAKLTQIRSYGGGLNRIPGTREDTARAALWAAANSYYASHSYNPFFFQGTKTFAYEVCEQLGWRAPEVVVLPLGNGTLLLGAHLGFTELREAGITSGVPRLVGIQAAACAPLHAAWEGGLDEPAVVESRETVAEGIAIARPIRGSQILRAVRETGGTIVTVSEEEIRRSLVELCRQGFYVEPTSAATTAGLARYTSRSDGQELVVSVLTGHGLKSSEKVAALSPDSAAS